MVRMFNLLFLLIISGCGENNDSLKTDETGEPLALPYSNHHQFSQANTTIAHSTVRSNYSGANLETKSATKSLTTAIKSKSINSPRPTEDIIVRLKKEGFTVAPLLEEDLRLWNKDKEERKKLLEKKALEIEPKALASKNATLLSQLAMLRLLQKKSDKAREALKLAIEIDSKAVRDFYAAEKKKQELIKQLTTMATLNIDRVAYDTADLYKLLSDYEIDQAYAHGEFEGMARLLFQIDKGEIFP